MISNKNKLVNYTYILLFYFYTIMLNFVNLGIVSTEPELKTTPNGNTVCSLIMLVNYYDKWATDNQWNVTNQWTLWIKVTGWDNEKIKNASYLAQLSKWDTLFLNAELRNSTWQDQSWVSHSRLETLRINTMRWFPKGSAYNYISSKTGEQSVNQSQNPVAKPVAKAAPVVAAAQASVTQSQAQAPVANPVAQAPAIETPNFDFWDNNAWLDFDFWNDWF